jgi:plasmid stability protein
MTSILVEGLEEAVGERIAMRAKQHGTTVEVEARNILTRAVQMPNLGVALMHAAAEVGGVDDLLIPERTEPARAMDFA